MKNIEYNDVVEYISIAYAIFNWLAKVYEQYTKLKDGQDRNNTDENDKKTTVGRWLRKIGRVFNTLMFAIRTLPRKILNKNK